MFICKVILNILQPLMLLKGCNVLIYYFHAVDAYFYIQEQMYSCKYNCIHLFIIHGIRRNLRVDVRHTQRDIETKTKRNPNEKIKFFVQLILHLITLDYKFT